MLHTLLLRYCCYFVRIPFWIKVLTLTLGHSRTVFPETMSILESQVRGLGDTSGGEASAKQKSEGGAGTQNNDDLNVFPGLEAGLEQQARDDDKDLHEEGQDAEASGEAEEEEQKQMGV